MMLWNLSNDVLIADTSSVFEVSDFRYIWNQPNKMKALELL